MDRGYKVYLSIYLSIYLWLYSHLLDLGKFFSFLIFYTVSRTPWAGEQPVVRPLPAHRTAQTQNKRRQTSMPQVGLELTIPLFEQAKTVHALDRAAAVIGDMKSHSTVNRCLCLHANNAKNSWSETSIDNVSPISKYIY
jgi:hypothetical protein